MADRQETYRCSTCKKQFHADGFKVSRLGVRNKTCLECAERKRTWLAEVRADPARHEKWKLTKRASNARSIARRQAEAAKQSSKGVWGFPHAQSAAPPPQGAEPVALS